MSELTFEQLLNEESMKTIHTGEVVDGTVIDVKPDQIVLNINYKSDGILTRNEYTNDATLDLTTVVKPGDTMTLDQALRILLLYSANDVAMLVAEGVAGSVDAFVEMMNQEARQIGATNTNFVNPHGLTAEGHLTTAYDLYLIFNEALKYETFREIIQMSSYQTTYYDASGAPVTVDKKTTNLFLRGDYTAPSNVTVIGGKTGTTSAAGHCLVLFSKDAAGSSYISVILKSDDTLYEEMTRLLEEI